MTRRRRQDRTVTRIACAKAPARSDPPRNRLRFGSVLLLILIAFHAQAAPTTQPASQPATQTRRAPDPVKIGQFEQVPLRAEARSSSSAASQPAALSAATPPTTPATFDTGRVALALGAVIVLILVLRWIAKGLFATSAAPRAGGAMRVLSRMAVSPKQQLLLVQVGRRVVIVGDCGTQMNALTEITDPDEIAALVGQIHRDQSRPGSRGFGAFFGRAQDPFKTATSQRDEKLPEHHEESVEEPDEATSAMTGEIAGLMEKIRNVSSQFRRT